MKNRVVTSSYLQMESAECGAVCLQIILAYYENYQSLEKLRALCGVSRDGVSAGSIIKAAKTFGLTAETLFAELPEDKSINENLLELCEKEFPYIVFWEFNHFVVVEGIKNNAVYLNDPAEGRYMVDYETFSSAFTGIIIKFNKTEDFSKEGTPIKTWSSLWRRLYPNMNYFIHIIVITLMLVIPGILIPGISKIFIDYIIVQHQIDWLKLFLWSFMFVSLYSAILSWLKSRTLLYLETKLSCEQSALFFKHLLSLPINFFEQRLAGDLSYRIDANDRVAQLLCGNVSHAFVSLISIILFSLVMIILSLKLFLVTLGFALLQITTILYFSNEIGQKAKLHLQQQSKLIGLATNYIELIEAIKLQGLENNTFNQIDIERNKTLATRKKLLLRTEWLTIFQQSFLALNSLLILFLGVSDILHGVLTVGTLLAFTMIFSNIQGPLGQLGSIILAFKNIQGDLARLDDVLSHPAFITGKEGITQLSLSKQIDIREISFGYYSFAEPLLKNISFLIKPGQSIGIVGGVGSGKSTLLKCIAGLYSLWEGQILVDDQVLTQLSDESRAKLFGVMSQSIHLFSGTIRQNLNFANESISDDIMIESCKLAEIYDELLIQGGLDAPVKHLGQNFSAGQLQRIELARILCRKPACLLLDEATSALDRSTEQKVLNNIVKNNCAVVMAAHRLETIKNCHVILVLEQGRIVESGTHEKLCGNQNLYWNLIQQGQT